MDKDDNKNTQQNLTSAENQENKKNQNKVSNPAVKGLATGAGAVLGGKVGASVGSKAADVINNSNIRNKVPKLQGNFPNQNGLISPNNQQLKKQSPNSQLPTSSLQTDTNSEKPSPTTNNKNQLDKTNNQRSSNKNASRELSNKNPTQNKYANILKKHSKHANGNNNEEKDKDTKSDTPKNDNPLINRLNPLRKRRMLSQNKQKAENEENEIEETTGQQVLNVLGGTFKKILSIVAGMIGITPFVLSGILIAILIIVICVVIIPIISIFSFYGKEEDGTACYNTPSCNKVIIKGENGNKTYSLDEYIAGAIVNYYDHDSYAVADADVDQNLLKAFSVIIHSDIAAYSDYDGNNETCTVNEESRFSDIYIPTSNDYTSDDTTTDSSSNENSGNSSDNEVDGISGADAGQNTQIDDSTTENEETKKKDKYYNQAKSAAASVLSEVVDIYTQKLDIFYDNYKSIVNTSSATGNDYKTIIRDYIKGSPDYEEVKDSTVNNDDYTDDDTKDDNNGDPIGIYPVCSFQKANSSDTSTGTISIAGDFCTQVKVLDSSGNLKGVYPFEEFIEGVVYHEARAWYQSSDTMKAHAVAARTWLYNAVKTNYHASIDGNTCTIEISGSTLWFTENTIPAIHQAVTETTGEYIIIDGKISSNGKWDALAIRDGYYQNKDSEYYTLAQKNQKIPKSWLDKQYKSMSIPDYIRLSHGDGMSQYGAYYLATVENKNYKEIINYYYGADISKVSNGYVMPINTFSMITGEVSVGYCQSGGYHPGLDFAAPSGTPVYAATSGVIEKEYSYTYQCLPETYKDGSKNPHYHDCVQGYNSNYADNSAGQGFKIKNDDGTYSVYFHFSKKENLHVGDRVTAGQKIGEVGTTGKSTGPHLHYEMRPSSTGKPLEPRDYLPMEGYEICHNNPNFRR